MLSEEKYIPCKIISFDEFKFEKRKYLAATYTGKIYYGFYKQCEVQKNNPYHARRALAEKMLTELNNEIAEACWKKQQNEFLVARL